MLNGDLVTFLQPENYGVLYSVIVALFRRWLRRTLGGLQGSREKDPLDGLKTVALPEQPKYGQAPGNPFSPIY